MPSIFVGGAGLPEVAWLMWCLPIDPNQRVRWISSDCHTELTVSLGWPWIWIGALFFFAIRHWGVIPEHKWGKVIAHHMADIYENPSQWRWGVGWGGVGIAVITICHENHNLHLRGGASEKEDSASPREDKILPRTCICFFHRHRRYPTAKH